jgi:hypothetical protein
VIDSLFISSNPTAIAFALDQLKQKGDRFMKLGDRTPSSQTKKRSLHKAVIALDQKT